MALGGACGVGLVRGVTVEGLLLGQIEPLLDGNRPLDGEDAELAEAPGMIRQRLPI